MLARSWRGRPRPCEASAWTARKGARGRKKHRKRFQSCWGVRALLSETARWGAPWPYSRAAIAATGSATGTFAAKAPKVR